MSTQKPVNVSPIIKAGRWGFLVAGILYGINKKAVLSVVDAKLKVIREKEALHRAEERKKASEKVIAELIGDAKTWVEPSKK